MIIFPAIDIRNGKCVRLYQGREDQETVYFENPVEVAKMWLDKGAEYLHIVDLNGAFSGNPDNRAIIKEIVSTVNIPVQVGGGVRNLEAAQNLMDLGVERFIVGTVAVKQPEILDQMIEKYGEKVVVSLDCWGGKVCVDGWVKESAVDAVDFAKKLKSKGIKTIVYTDISKDGTLEGPNLEELKRISEETGLDVIASGGIGSVEDVKAVEAMGLYGTIIGKALYEGRIDLAEL